jgi:hypothetical protein
MVDSAPAMRTPVWKMFFQVATHSSLRVTTALAAAADIVDMSPVALHLWLRKIGL